MTPKKLIAPLILLLLVGSAFVLPAAAGAEIRTGTGTDPVGDSLGAPSQDLVSSSAQYDTNGQASVTATMNGPIATGPESFISFSIASYAAPSGCTGVTLSMFGSTTSGIDVVLVTGVKATGSSNSFVNGNSISFGAGGTALANRDWSCMQVNVSGAGGTPLLDRIEVPVWFKGFGPDSDSDGIVDNEDMCPTVVGVAPTGCPAAIPTPPAAAPTTPTSSPSSTPQASTPSGPSASTQAKVKHCLVPKLTGKTLEASKKMLGAADCKLGKVTKKKGATAKTAKVVSQGDKAGAVLPSGTVVKVTLGQG